ncbi:MAG: hypothetical protein EZS28_008155 [Streblomastix strix]|uniref:Uncharacterized protein n=1 Tax=Streblomastix strix TaxID=222440 RepID=A0A5J4WML4_9EUKA|nr:MAG: hypothetical protein EZS28_008155 [Streblomastix strix]
MQKIIILELQVQNIQQQINGESQDIAQLQADGQVINTELAQQTHFRGYFTTNAEILALTGDSKSDYTYGAEDLSVWIYETSLYETDQIVPDQVTSACDNIPTVDNGEGSAVIQTDYARGDHQPPLNITTSISSQNSTSGSIGTTNCYARNDHSHPINVESNTSNIPIVNGVGINGTSTFYVRQDHVHPQQMTYDGNVATTKFIITGGLATEILYANGDTTTIGINFVQKTGQELYVIEGTIRKREDDEELVDGDYLTRKEITDGFVSIATDQTITAGTYSNAKIPQQFILIAGTPTSFAGITSGNIQIIYSASCYDDGLRIARTVQNTGSASIQLGCSRTSNTGAAVGQLVASQAGDNTRGLQFSADGNTLTFNGQVI